MGIFRTNPRVTLEDKTIHGESASAICDDLIAHYLRGAIDWQRSLEIASNCFERGFQSLVVSASLEEYGEMNRRLCDFETMLRRLGMPMNLRPAIHVDLNADTLEQVTRSAILGNRLNRRYAVIRLRPDTSFSLVPIVESIRRIGLKCILLGADECLSLRASTKQIERLTQLGVLMGVMTERLSRRSITRLSGSNATKILRHPNNCVLQIQATAIDAPSINSSAQILESIIGQTDTKRLVHERITDLWKSKSEEPQTIAA
ncbi:MAG: hypothetical protein AAF664_22245 [Planctomycetota bacterium]